MSNHSPWSEPVCLLFSWKCSQVSSIFKTKKDLVGKILTDRHPFGEACSTLFSPDCKWRELSYPSLHASIHQRKPELVPEGHGGCSTCKLKQLSRFHFWLFILLTRSCYSEWHKNWACNAATAAHWQRDGLRWQPAQVGVREKERGSAKEIETCSGARRGQKNSSSDRSWK